MKLIIARSILMAAALSLAFFALPALSASVQSDGANMTETPGEFLNDSAITLKVKAGLIADSSLSSLQISVSTDKGIVTLSGTVKDAAEKQKAVDITTQTSGVISVTDKLVINPSNG